MELEGNLLSAALSDALVFIFELILSAAFIFKRHKGFERLFFIFYSLVTFSAYNIFIQVVHDYNLPIARTALFKVPVFLNLYLLDIIALIACIIIFARVFLGRSKMHYMPSSSHGLMYQYYIRDVTLFFLSTVSFFLLIISDNLVDPASQLRPLRGLALGVFFGWMYFQLAHKINGYPKLYYVLTTFVILDSINILGELISAPYFGQYLWDRGGHKVLLVDQANFMLALCYLPLLFSWRRFGKSVSFFGWIILLALLYDYIKGLYFFIPLSIFLFVFVLFLSKGRIPKLFFSLTVPALLVGIMVLPNIFNDRAISGTRSIQLNAYLDYIEKNPPMAILGSGIGGMFPVYEETGDKGSIKEVDRKASSNNNFQVQFQIPFIYYYKIAGILGLGVVLFAFSYGLMYSMRIVKINLIGGYYVIVALIVGLLFPPFLNSDPNVVVYFLRISFMVSALSSIFLHENNRWFSSSTRPISK